MDFASLFFFEVQRKPLNVVIEKYLKVNYFSLDLFQENFLILLLLLASEKRIKEGTVSNDVKLATVQIQTRLIKRCRGN
ncbi:hypothetical protein RIF29_15532 [Crotalaria pallida]|uniref:Uncharacterized protein n=1 Tax=Crotalaria pallida TaxID=3830 RepID=A0AAN9FF83_CROPI